MHTTVKLFLQWFILALLITTVNISNNENGKIASCQDPALDVKCFSEYNALCKTSGGQK